MVKCSKWCPSRFSARSASFFVYINDIDQGVVSQLCKFADHTKFGANVGDTFGVENLKADLKRVFQWFVEWQILFNVDKCTVMHMGKTNKKT